LPSFLVVLVSARGGVLGSGEGLLLQLGDSEFVEHRGATSIAPGACKDAVFFILQGEAVVRLLKSCKKD
jgi:hypothetical protein